METHWHISVLRKRDTAIKLRVTKADPAGENPGMTKPFLMRVFADQAFYSDGTTDLSTLSYLSRVLGPNNRLRDTAACKELSREAIARFDVIEKSKDSFTYSITVTDPKWIEGIDVGSEWESQAY